MKTQNEICNCQMVTATGRGHECGKSFPQHTPTPWKWANGQLVSMEGEIIAEKNDDGSPDAAYIVRAVNSHEELLSLMKDVGNWLEVHLELGHINAGTGNRDGDLVSQIRAVITKAEQK